MDATLMDILMILSLGILAGTGTGLFAGFIARKQKRTWAEMDAKDKKLNIAFIIVFSIFFCSLLAWYLFVYLAS